MHDKERVKSGENGYAFKGKGRKAVQKDTKDRNSGQVGSYVTDSLELS